MAFLLSKINLTYLFAISLTLGISTGEAWTKSTPDSPALVETGITFSEPYTWLFGGWVAPPRLPMLADVNGD
jgi:hypothetical protein